MDIIRDNKRVILAIFLIPLVPALLVIGIVLSLVAMLFQFLLALALVVVGDEDGADRLLERPAPGYFFDWWVRVTNKEDD